MQASRRTSTQRKCSVAAPPTKLSRTSSDSMKRTSLKRMRLTIVLIAILRSKCPTFRTLSPSRRSSITSWTKWWILRASSCSVLTSRSNSTQSSPNNRRSRQMSKNAKSVSRYLMLLIKYVYSFSFVVPPLEHYSMKKKTI